MNRFPLKGFSLIELLTTLAIVAILAVISVPHFSGLVARSRRSDAMAALLDLQLAQERLRALNDSYVPTLSGLGRASSASPQGYYRLRVNSADDSGFLVTATPVGVQRSDRCGVFAVDEQGPHYQGGFADEHCWRR
jgi:type IV pilus assembly protein PilE